MWWYYSVEFKFIICNGTALLKQKMWWYYSVELKFNICNGTALLKQKCDDTIQLNRNSIFVMEQHF